MIPIDTIRNIDRYKSSQNLATTYQLCLATHCCCTHQRGSLFATFYTSFREITKGTIQFLKVSRTTSDLIGTNLCLLKRRVQLTRGHTRTTSKRKQGMFVRIYTCLKLYTPTHYRRNFRRAGKGPFLVLLASQHARNKGKDITNRHSMEETYILIYLYIYRKINK